MTDAEKAAIRAAFREKLLAAGQNLDEGALVKSTSWHRLLLDRLTPIIMLVNSAEIQLAFGDDYEEMHGRFKSLFTQLNLAVIDKPRAHHKLDATKKRKLLKGLEEVVPEE